MTLILGSHKLHATTQNIFSPEEADYQLLQTGFRELQQQFDCRADNGDNES